MDLSYILQGLVLALLSFLLTKVFNVAERVSRVEEKLINIERILNYDNKEKDKRKNR